MRVYLQMDLIWRCLVSVSAMIYGGCCLERICCKSSIVVCIHLVFRVKAVMVG